MIISIVFLLSFLQDIYHVLITADVVKGVASPGYWKKGQAVRFWEAWATEEGAYSKKNQGPEAMTQ